MSKIKISGNMAEINEKEANKPCLICDRSAEEEGMIGCHECESWLHYSCDPEVENEEYAKKIQKYYCRPCREKGEEIKLYRAASINRKDNCNFIHDEEIDTKSNENTSINEESDVEYAEEAILSPIITPNKCSTNNETKIEVSDHELTELIESVPDEFNNEWRMKDIVEKIKRVSISNEQDEITNSEKPQKKKKKPLKKAMQHRKKTDILKEYDKLNQEIEKLNTAKEKAETKIIQLEKSLATEQQYREKMEKLEKELQTKDDSSMEKRIYEAENLKITNEKKITSLQEKIEDYKKKNADKQNEIKELKMEQEVKLNEITTLKTAYEKETDLRTKAESLLHLTNEKLEAQIMLYEQEKTYNEDKAKQIEKLKEKIELQNETEANNRQQIEMLEKELRAYNTLEPKEPPPNPNIIDDNREMVKIIEKLEQEKHELTVQVVEANIEINIRKKLVEELNETHNSHLEKISKAYIENCIQFQKNAEKQIKATRKYEEITNKIDIDEVESLMEKLKEKSSEVDSLKKELHKIGEEKYEKIKKETEPRAKPQGIPNKYINGCFMIAPIHALATNINIETLEKEKGENNIAEHILEVKECLNGKKNDIEAEEIMENIWDFSSERWSYTQRNGIAKQQDATEYMDRILLNSESLRYETEVSFTLKAECTNRECELVSTTQRKKSNTNATSTTKGIDKIELQDLINEHLLRGTEVCSACHQDSNITKEIEKAPNTLVIDIPRHTDEGEKIETEVVHSRDRIFIYEKEVKVEYQVVGVIIHRGNQGQNGHYIYNQYDYANRIWKQIDDNMIHIGNEYASENKQGTIFILRKLEKTEEYRKRSTSLYRGKVRNITPQETPYTSTTRNTDYPCKFYKYDKCTKGNTCRFLHHTCRDFLQGECKYNDYCRYRHPSNEYNSTTTKTKTPRNPQY